MKNSIPSCPRCGATAWAYNGSRFDYAEYQCTACLFGRIRMMNPLIVRAPIEYDQPLSDFVEELRIRVGPQAKIEILSMETWFIPDPRQRNGKCEILVTDSELENKDIFDHIVELSVKYNRWYFIIHFVPPPYYTGA